MIGHTAPMEASTLLCSLTEYEVAKFGPAKDKALVNAFFMSVSPRLPPCNKARHPEWRRCKDSYYYVILSIYWTKSLTLS